ncbi:hypothetical protein [Nosocomiicoccus ampullae]|uniref:hypothetical protein n=1 Tax=Nosocomiicoccus ampullae TaxID=489910 RepID=UPI001C5E8BF3|nr:hypothetical protein [Nosocomiicoccus ampullae]QYA48432.1 hypothetical protein KPF52_08605 [Nosocomiicoccus ampullae]
MPLILCAILLLMFITVWIFSKKNTQKNRISAAYLLLTVPCILLGVYFNNYYSLIFYSLSLLSGILALIFAFKNQDNHA